MMKSDIPVVKRGLCEINWEGTPEDQKRLITREEADGRVVRHFAKNIKDEKLKLAVFIAIAGGKTAGFVSIGEWENSAVGSILDLWVSEEYRGRGIGSQLLDFALEEVRRRGYTHSNLMVSVANTKARGMYERRGFRPQGLLLSKRVNV